MWTPASRAAASTCSTLASWVRKLIASSPVGRSRVSNGGSGGGVSSGSPGVITTARVSSRVSSLAVGSHATTCAVVDDGDDVAELLGLLQVVGGEQDGDALAVEAHHIVPELAAQLDVDAGGGLVEDQHRRVVHHRLGHHQPPLHAARERAHVGVGLVRQAERGEQLVGDALGPRHAVHAGLHVQRLARGEEDVGGDLLRHHADGGARVAGPLVDVAAPDGDRARGLLGQAREDVDEGRLAGAVGAEQAEDRAARDLQVDALQRVHRAARRAWPDRSSRGPWPRSHTREGPIRSGGVEGPRLD